MSLSVCDLEENIIDEIELKFRPQSNFIDDEALKVNGFSRFELARFPDHKESTLKLVEFFKKHGEGVMVCHALWFGHYFDWSFLQIHLEKSYMRYELYRHVRKCESTITWFKHISKLGGDHHASYSLASLCDFYSVKLSHHDARSDREACQKLYWIARKKLINLGIEGENLPITWRKDANFQGKN